MDRPGKYREPVNQVPLMKWLREQQGLGVEKCPCFTTYSIGKCAQSDIQWETCGTLAWEKRTFGACSIFVYGRALHVWSHVRAIVVVFRLMNGKTCKGYLEPLEINLCKAANARKSTKKSSQETVVGIMCCPFLRRNLSPASGAWRPSIIVNLWTAGC